MNKLLSGLLAGLLALSGVPHARAQNTQAGLTALITSTLPDNTVGAITPGVMRNVLTSMVLSSTCAGASQIVTWNASQLPSCLGGTANQVLHGGSPPSFGAIANADMATMAASTVKCNSSASTATPVDCNYPTINVKDPAYGCVGNGVADDTTCIQNAINALPTSGGEVLLPVGSYKVSSTLNIGNGNSTPTASTRNGIILRGLGNPTGTAVAGYPTVSAAKLVWAGGGSPVIMVQGPLSGWGVQNLGIDCQSAVGAIGIQEQAAALGDSSNLQIVNCSRGVGANSYPNRGNLHNAYHNIHVTVPALAGAIGILLTGDGVGTTSNTSFDHFENIDIAMPGSALITFGIYLQAADSNYFYNVHVSGGGTGSTAIGFDYAATGVAGQWPASNGFFGLEPAINPIGTQFQNGGTPGAAAANIIYGLGLTNGGTCPTLANLSCHSPAHFIPNAGGNVTAQNALGAWQAYTPTPTCGTATFTTNSARRLTVGKTTSISADFQINAIGTCVNNLTFTLPVGAQNTGSLVGTNSNNGHLVGCRMSGTTATCNDATAAALGANDHFIMSGVYENQ